MNLGDHETAARDLVTQMVDNARPVLSQYRTKAPGAMYEVGINADPESFGNGCGSGREN
jgi:hypothetical protein